MIGGEHGHSAQTCYGLILCPPCATKTGLRHQGIGLHKASVGVLWYLTCHLQQIL